MTVQFMWGLDVAVAMWREEPIWVPKVAGVAVGEPMKWTDAVRTAKSARNRGLRRVETEERTRC